MLLVAIDDLLADSDGIFDHSSWQNRYSSFKFVFQTQQKVKSKSTVISLYPHWVSGLIPSVRTKALLTMIRARILQAMHSREMPANMIVTVGTFPFLLIQMDDLSIFKILRDLLVMPDDQIRVVKSFTQ